MTEIWKYLDMKHYIVLKETFTNKYMHLITEDPITPEIAALHQIRVTAEVAENASNTVQAATSTIDIGFWHSIINWIISIFS